MEVAALIIRQKIDKPVRLHVKQGSGIRVRTPGQRAAVKGARIYTVQRGPKVKRASTKMSAPHRYSRKGSDAYRQGKRYYTTGRYQADPYYNKKRQVQAIQKEGYRKGKELKGKEKSRPGITKRKEKAIGNDDMTKDRRRTIQKGEKPGKSRSRQTQKRKPQNGS